MRKRIIVCFIIILVVVILLGEAFYFFAPPAPTPTPSLTPTPTPPLKPEEKTLSISGPKWVEVGASATFTVTSEGKPVEGVTVKVAGMSGITRTDGTVSVTFDKDGDYELAATKEGYRGIPQTLFQDDCSNSSQWVAWCNDPSVPLSPHSRNNPVKEGWSFEEEAGNSFLNLEGKLWVGPRPDAQDRSGLFWANYSFVSRFRIVEGALHAVFRLNARGRYLVGLNSGQISFMKDFPNMSYSREPFSDPSVHQFIEGEDANIGTSWHKLEIIALGKAFSVYIDGGLVFDWTDNDTEFERRPYLTGVVYFETESSDSYAQVDDVIVSLASQERSTALAAIKVYPNGNERIKFRGAKEGPGLALRYFDARSVGANIVEVTQDCYINSTTCLIETQPAKEVICARILSAHYRGLMVYYKSFLWWDRYIHKEGVLVPEHAEQKFLEDLSKVALDSARFAQENGVEMYSPLDGLNEFIPRDVAGKWYQRILPEIRAVYSGFVIIGMNDIWRVAETKTGTTEDPSRCEYNYTGYDYTTLTVWFSDWRHESFDPSTVEQVYSEYRKDVRTLVEVGLKWSKKYGTKGVIVPFVNLDFKEKFVKAQMANGLTMGEIRAKALNIFFQETLGKLDGILVGMWQESASQKCFERFYPEGRGIGKQHMEVYCFGYQGPEVEELVKRYYTVQSSSTVTTITVNFAIAEEDSYMG